MPDKYPELNDAVRAIVGRDLAPYEIALLSEAEEGCFACAMWTALDRLGGDVYCRKRLENPVTWEEVFAHVSWLEQRAYSQGRSDGWGAAIEASKKAIGGL